MSRAVPGADLGSPVGLSPRHAQEAQDVIPMIERIPSLSDDDLASLNDNARRLAENGTALQIAAASAILPALAVELAAREQRHKEARADARAARKKVVKTAIGTGGEQPIP